MDFLTCLVASILYIGNGKIILHHGEDNIKEGQVVLEVVAERDL